MLSQYDGERFVVESVSNEKLIVASRLRFERFANVAGRNEVTRTAVRYQLVETDLGGGNLVRYDRD